MGGGGGGLTLSLTQRVETHCLDSINVRQLYESQFKFVFLHECHMLFSLKYDVSKDMKKIIPQSAAE